MVYGNKQIAQVFYGSQQVRTIWLNNKKVFGSRFKMGRCSYSAGANNYQTVYWMFSDNVLKFPQFGNLCITNVQDAARNCFQRNGKLWYYDFSQAGELVIHDEPIGDAYSVLYNERFHLTDPESDVIIAPWMIGIATSGSMIFGAISENGVSETGFIYTWEVDGAIIKAVPTLWDDYGSTGILLTGNGNLYTFDGYNAEYADHDRIRSQSDLTGWTDIIDTGSDIRGICNGKLYKLTRYNSVQSNSLEFIADVTCDKFPELTASGDYSIVDGKLYCAGELMADTPENFRCLYPYSDGRKDDVEVYAFTANERLFRLYGSTAYEIKPQETTAE